MLGVLIGIALHVAAGDTINDDAETAIPACSNDLDPGAAAFSKNVMMASDPASRVLSSSKTSVTTCRHRAAQGEAVILRVKFVMPSQPSSRTLELRWVREVARHHLMHCRCIMYIHGGRRPCTLCRVDVDSTSNATAIVMTMQLSLS